jgi:hypothetical protein
MRLSSIKLTSFTSDLRQRLNTESNWEKARSGGLNVVIKGVPVGLSGETAEALHQKLTSSNDYVLDWKEFAAITVEKTDKAAYDTFLECMRNSAGLTISSTVAEPDLVEFEVQLVQPRGGTIEPPKITGHSLSQGAIVLDPTGISEGKVLVSPARVLVSRQQNQAVVFQLHTTLGSASCFVPRVEPIVQAVTVTTTPRAWHSTDETGVPYVEIFTHATEYMHNVRGGKLASGTYTLTKHPSGKISSIEFRCEPVGHPDACAFNYHQKPEGGYKIDVTINPDKRSFVWRRRWASHVCNEYYTVYYEVYR